MQINPITKKDIKITSRGKRFFIELFIYEVIVMIAFIIAIDTFFGKGNVKSADYNSFSGLFPAVSIVQMIIVSFIIPVMTGASISGEKERQTFDIMLTTAMKPFSIVWGKLSSVDIRVLMFVIASLPLVAVSFVSGSISWSMLFMFIGMMVVYSFFVASIGIYASAICRKSMTAIILSFTIMFFMALGTILIAAVEIISFGKLIISSIFLLFNPVLYFEELFMIANGKMYFISVSSFEDLASFDKGYSWILISTIAMIIMTVLFMYLAARRIDPLKRRK